MVFRRFDGQMHGFFTQVGILTATDEAIGFIAGAVQDHLQGSDD